MDREGAIDMVGVTDTCLVSNASVCSWADTGVWNMVSVPAVVYDAAGIKANSRLARWNEAGEARDVYAYYQNEANISQISAGSAYWKKSTGVVTVSLTPDKFATAPVKIPLAFAQYGWNQVASPYPYPVKWTRTDIAVWEWNPALRDFQLVDGVVMPWKGYWVMAAKRDSIVLQPDPVYVRTSLSKKAKTFFTDKSQWNMQFVLMSEFSQDADNIIGFSGEAKDGHDELDRAEPPRLGGDPYLFIDHSEWKKPASEYASDVRRAFKDKVNIFQLGVNPGDGSARNVAIGTRGVAAMKDVFVYIGNQDGVEQVSGESEIAVVLGNNTSYQTVFVTADRNFLKNFPYNFRMGLPYPNPFGPRVNLRYTLPYRWEKNGWLNTEQYEVRLDIFDARGRLVRQLANRKQEPGNYMVTWDGKSNTGSRVAAGSYVCRLVAGKYTGNTSMVLIK
jgi:hypothetical protein